MLLPDNQRRLLGAFIRARREALRPAGLAGRRRTPGLRREEAAERAGLSVTWYTWVEQGRDITLSTEALARLAVALRLTPAERSYLFELSRRRDPAAGGAAPDAGAPPDLMGVLDAVSAPAYLLDALWCRRACNDGAAHLFAPWLASGEASLLRWVFLDPVARLFIADWDNRARRLVAEFRADTVAIAGDAAFRAFLDGLSAASPAFAGAWTDQAVLSREGGMRGFNHPDDGPVHRRQVTLRPASHPDHKVVILLPA